MYWFVVLYFIYIQLLVLCDYLVYQHWRNKLNHSAIYLAKLISKLILIASFVGYALYSKSHSYNATECFMVWPSYDNGIIIGLILCGIGDLILVFDNGLYYGLIAFLFGHLVYIMTMVIHLNISWFIFSLVGFSMFLLNIQILRWLKPFIKHNRPEMWNSIIIYSLVLSIMVTISNSITNHDYELFKIGALLFMYSDIGVAQNSFVGYNLIDRIVCINFYFIAQLSIASTVGHPNYFE